MTSFFYLYLFIDKMIYLVNVMLLQGLTWKQWSTRILVLPFGMSVAKTRLVSSLCWSLLHIQLNYNRRKFNVIQKIQILFSAISMFYWFIYLRRD